MSSCLAERLGAIIELSAAEHAVLDGIEQRERALKKGAVLVRERDRLTELFIVRRGIVMSYGLLQDGSRQILRFFFPGDVVADAAFVYRHSPETVAALTDSVVTPVERAVFAALLAEHPRLSAALMVLGQIERVALTDRLAALGRTSAKGRVAALLIEVRNRMRAVDRTVGSGFTLRLTQEEIGDATGLTAVHVNRMLRQLEEEGLIDRAGGRVTFIDEPGLARIGNHVDRYAGLDLGWLPPARR